MRGEGYHLPFLSAAESPSALAIAWRGGPPKTMDVPVIQPGWGMIFLKPEQLIWNSTKGGNFTKQNIRRLNEIETTKNSATDGG